MSADDIKTTLLERHRSDGARDCGAYTKEMPCKWSKNSTHHRHCTEQPGHEGDHKDAIHCWSFETFTNDEVIGYKPRDLARCETCNHSWPCRERQFLDALFAEASA